MMKQMRFVRAAVAGGLAGLLGLGALGVGAADQPQWGEAWSRNMVSGEKGLASSFDPGTGKNIKWVVEIGNETHSTPIVANGRVYIGTNNANPRDPKHVGDRGVLMCFEEGTGKFLWQLVVPKWEGDNYRDWPNTGMASPATVEGDRVYMLTNRAEVVCLDAKGMADGNDGPYRDEGRHMALKGEAAMTPGETDADVLWMYDLHAEAGVWQHDGPNASILVHGDLIYVCSNNGVDNTHRKIRRPEAPSLVVLDKRTGELVATDDLKIGKDVIHSTWSSPSVGVVNGKELVFFGGGNGWLYAFEAMKEAPKEGEGPVKLKEVWRFDCDPTGPKENVHQYMGNKQKSASNILGMPVFVNGRVYVTAGGDTWWGKRQAWLRCVDATMSGDVTSAAEKWAFEMKAWCMATPAVSEGLVYVTDGGKNIHCVDAETGKLYWSNACKGEFWSSALVADGKVYAGTRRGDFWILAAGKEHQVLHQVQMDSGITGTATAANGVVYVATMRKLYAIQQRE